MNEQLRLCRKGLPVQNAIAYQNTFVCKLPSV